MPNGFSEKTCDILKQPLPKYSRRGQAGLTFTYYKGSDVIKRLNDAFGHGWSSKKLEVTEYEGQVLMLVAVTVNTGGECVTHEGYGSAEVARHTTGEKRSISIGNTYKSAFTNALKKAAEQFGIGLGEEDEEDTLVNTSITPKPISNASSRSTMSMPHAPRPMPNNRTIMSPSSSFSKAATTNVSNQGGAPIIPVSPPMKIPDLSDEVISDVQKKALQSLAGMKKRSVLDLIRGALPGTEKTSFDQLLKSEAIKVITYATTLSQG